MPAADPGTGRAGAMGRLGPVPGHAGALSAYGMAPHCRICRPRACGWLRVPRGMPARTAPEGAAGRALVGMGSPTGPQRGPRAPAGRHFLTGAAGLYGMSDPQMEKPHPVWWLAHLFFGILSGLVVYVLYKDKNPAAARFHLIGSLVIMAAITAAVMVSAVLVGVLIP